MNGWYWRQHRDRRAGLQYADWDVYVRSNQPEATVTASSGNYSHSWHADASGYADVHLRGPFARPNHDGDRPRCQLLHHRRLTNDHRCYDSLGEG